MGLLAWLKRDKFRIETSDKSGMRRIARYDRATKRWVEVPGTRTSNAVEIHNHLRVCQGLITREELDREHWNEIHDFID